MKIAIDYTLNSSHPEIIVFFYDPTTSAPIIEELKAVFAAIRQQLPNVGFQFSPTVCSFIGDPAQVDLLHIRLRSYFARVAECTSWNSTFTMPEVTAGVR